MLASHALDEFEVIEFRSPIGTDASLHGTPASALAAGSKLAREADIRTESKSEGIRCIRGSLIALGLEAAMAFCVYGIWQIWHILR